MKRPVLFWIGSVLNIMMIPLLFYNVVVAVALGFIGFIIARSSGCTFDEYFEKELAKNKPAPHVIQAAYLLHATMTDAASVGAKLKVFCMK